MDYTSVKTTFYPLYLHSRFFGCNLFHLPKSSKTTNVSIKLDDILILIVHVALYVCLFVFLNFAQSESDVILRNVLFHLTEKTGSLIMAFLGRILFYTFVLTNIFVNVMDLVNRNKIWKLLCELRDFDIKVGLNLLNFYHDGIVNLAFDCLLHKLIY